jgi:prepilin-type N-terminal cleavage/methylation domain-containing protein
MIKFLKKISIKKFVAYQWSPVSRDGFTVIELIISMSLFVIISGLVVGSFIIATRTQRTIISLIEAKDNMGLALEQMARETRLASNFQISSQYKKLDFNDINGNIIKYYYTEENGIGGITRCENFNCFPIISPALNIGNFYIYFSNDIGGITPPRITMSFSVSPKDNALKDYFSFNIQTTISARGF